MRGALTKAYHKLWLAFRANRGTNLTADEVDALFCLDEAIIAAAENMAEEEGWRDKAGRDWTWGR